jgi:CRISPR-associated protein Cmr3
MLLTPAHWREGSMPQMTGSENPLGERPGLRVTLDAALVGRPETISGWDFHARAPKATRRLVPAGSVLWLTLEGDPEKRCEWLERVWMQNVSDDETSRRDGFGLAVVGVA